jgi:hypothetical protein
MGTLVHWYAKCLRAGLGSKSERSETQSRKWDAAGPAGGGEDPQHAEADNHRDFYYECLFGHPVYRSTVLPGFGVDHFELMLGFQQTAGFGVMLIDSVGPDNRVEWDGRNAIRYRLAESDKTRLRFARARGLRSSPQIVAPDEGPAGPK